MAIRKYRGVQGMKEDPHALMTKPTSQAALSIGALGTALRVEHLWKAFGATQALADVSFDSDQGVFTLCWGAMGQASRR